MIHFFSVVQLLFILITVSSEKCHERNGIQVIGGTKESSHGTLSSPRFPQRFQTPFNQSWVIDASQHPNGTQINLYLTQMYLVKGVKFFQYPTFKFCDQDQYVVKPLRQDCRKPEEQFTPKINVPKLHDLVRISTTCPYLEIQVNVPTPWDYHYRTKDPFLFHTYGFNITYEIVSESVGIMNDSCNPRNCSSLGHCYIADNWKEFFCDCVKDHPGRYCEYSPYCDPENNVTFCFNGGTCKIVGSGAGYCQCKPEFTGARCEKRITIEPVAEQVTAKLNEPQPVHIVTKSSTCTPETSKSPCSCRPSPRSGRVVRANWRKFEAVISITTNYTSPGPQLTRLGYEMQNNISDWFKQKGQKDLGSVVVTFPTPPQGKSNPSELRIHFHGPLDNRTREVLKEWVDRGAVYFRTKIFFLKKSFVLYTIPRMKYKSIDINMQSRLKIGKTFILTCAATTGPSEYFSQNHIRFRWFKDDLPINISISARHMEMNDAHMPSHNETWSILIVDGVSTFDAGVFHCEVTDTEFGDRECGLKEIEVIQPPQVEVVPMSLTLQKQKLEKGIVVTCTDSSHYEYNPYNKSTDFVWYRSGTNSEVINSEIVVTEDIIPQGKLLRILRAEHSESFTCRGYSSIEGQARSKTVQVRVLDSKNSPSCKRQWERLAKTENKLLWEWTAPNTLAMIQCPEDFIGYVQRPCIVTINGKVQWGKSDFSKCISEDVLLVNLTLQNAMRGFGDWQTSSSVRLMERMQKYINTSQVLYHGEGEKIITVLEDIVKYAFKKGKVNGLFPVFFETVVKFLKLPNSCINEKSVLILTQMIVDVAVRGAMLEVVDTNSIEPQIDASDVFLLQTLSINATFKYQKISYMFPHQNAFRNSSMTWLKDKLSVNFPLDSGGFRRDSLMYYFVMVAYKNLSLVLASNDVVQERPKRNAQKVTELISPVVQISIPEGYYLPSDTPIKIHFNLSKEHRSIVRKTLKKAGASLVNNVATNDPYFSCGALDNTSSSIKIVNGELRWTHNACTLEIPHESYVECQCENSGIFGLLKVSNLEDEIPRVNSDIPGVIIAGLSFCILSCVLSTSVLCLYLKCRISTNSLYALKLADGFFVFCAVFIILIGRNEMSSSSWLLWSTSACSFLLASLSIQVTKALRVLLMEATIGTPGFIFPWLRNVSQITLLSAITFSTVLPVWTGTVAKIIGQDTSNESAFKETSHVFAIFVGTVGLVVLVFLAIYYKAVLKTRGELDTFQEQSSADMRWILTYRMKTLNRSLCLTLVLLVMTLGIILYENLGQSIFIQYFLGLSTIIMGTVLFLSYVTHSEYPITASGCLRTHSEKPPKKDPEKDFPDEGNGSQRKLYNISSDVAGNGSILGTTELLPPPPPPILRNPPFHLGEECEALSASTVEEQSMDTFTTDASYRAPSVVQVIPTASCNNKTSRSMRSGSSTSGSSYRSRKYPTAYSGAKPANAPCLIGGLTGDYIMPSNHTTSSSRGGDRHAMQEKSSSPTPSSSSYNYNNYLPIRDDDIQQKISQDLNILLKD